MRVKKWRGNNQAPEGQYRNRNELATSIKLHRSGIKS